jgi:CubicO group peptidase (beta-lactamase class C family)
VGYVIKRTSGGAFSYETTRAVLEHKPAGGTVLNNQTTFPSYPDGNIMTTAEDYARLMIMFLNRGAVAGESTGGDSLTQA